MEYIHRNILGTAFFAMIYTEEEFELVADLLTILTLATWAVIGLVTLILKFDLWMVFGDLRQLAAVFTDHHPIDEMRVGQRAVFTC